MTLPTSLRGDAEERLDRRARASCPSIEGGTPDLEATLKKLPDRPGVYLMRDALMLVPGNAVRGDARD